MVRAVFPGTFDPIHYGHIDIALRAAKLFDMLIIGVYYRPLKNLLFSPAERLEMAKTSFLNHPKITVKGYSNLTVDFCEDSGAQVIVRGLRVFSDFEYEFRMALANRRLKNNIDAVALITSEEHTFLSSSTVKEIASLKGDVSTMVPPHVEKALKLKISSNTKEDQANQYTSLRD
jgi:pantetheine-phosphate adenylyltransferase